MAISTTVAEKKAAVIAMAVDQLVQKDDGDTTILQEIKLMLNATFGEENNQIQKSTSSPAKRAVLTEEAIRKKVDEFGLSDRVWNTAAIQDIYRHIFGAYSTPNVYHPVYIRFPEVVIRNERSSHTITDLWVKFEVNAKGQLSMEALTGTRTSCTAEEYMAGYKHSHLNRGYHNTQFSAFCLGSGPISGIISNLRVKYNKDLFQLFLFNIKQYVAWESISGTPYIEMKTIRNRHGVSDITLSSITAARLNLYLKHAVEFIKNKPEGINLKLEGSRFSATITDELEAEISKFFLLSDTLRKIDLSSYFCYKNTDGSYVTGASVEVSVPKHTPILKFKEENIYLTISNKENVTETSKLLHPIFKYKLEDWLSSYFNSNYNREIKHSNPIKASAATDKY